MNSGIKVELRMKKTRDVVELSSLVELLLAFIKSDLVVHRLLLVQMFLLVQGLFLVHR